MVGIVAKRASIPGRRGGTAGFASRDLVGAPDNRARHVRQPPDARVLLCSPQILVPGIEDMRQRGERLRPSDMGMRSHLKGDLGDDAKGAERDERGAEEIAVLRGRAAHHLPVGEQQTQAQHRVGEQAVRERGAVGGGGDGARDGLVVDAAEVGHGEAVVLGLAVELFEPDAGLHGDDLGVAVDVEDAREVVEAELPGRGAGDVVGGVAASYDDYAAAAASGECDGFLDFFERFGLDEELGSRMKGFCPGVMDVTGGSAKWNAIVELGQLGRYLGMHHRQAEDGCLGVDRFLFDRDTDGLRGQKGSSHFFFAAQEQRHAHLWGV